MSTLSSLVAFASDMSPSPSMWISRDSLLPSCCRGTGLGGGEREDTDGGEAKVSPPICACSGSDVSAGLGSALPLFSPEKALDGRSTETDCGAGGGNTSKAFELSAGGKSMGVSEVEGVGSTIGFVVGAILTGGVCNKLITAGVFATDRAVLPFYD